MPEWKFVLINDTDHDCRIDLDTDFEQEGYDSDAEEDGISNMYSMNNAYAEALERLGYTLVTMRKD
jgi:hypothetical protein